MFPNPPPPSDPPADPLTAALRRLRHAVTDAVLQPAHPSTDPTVKDVKAIYADALHARDQIPRHGLGM